MSLLCEHGWDSAHHLLKSWPGFFMGSRTSETRLGIEVASYGKWFLGAETGSRKWNREGGKANPSVFYQVGHCCGQLELGAVEKPCRMCLRMNQPETRKRGHAYDGPRLPLVMSGFLAYLTLSESKMCAGPAGVRCCHCPQSTPPWIHFRQLWLQRWPVGLGGEAWEMASPMSLCSLVLRLLLI